MTPFAISVTFFLQLAVILGVCRLVGAAARLLGQPQVVGEMIAGVMLGPSLFGLLAPGLHARLFPAATMPVIYCFAQVGLALYMFLIGIELRTDLVRRRIKSAATVSLAGILAPFALGGLLAASLYRNHQLFGEGIRRPEAVLFLGAAMSITAFPMLARIIYESGLTGTALGALALAAGSIDDVLAWSLLAVVLASVGGKVSIAVWAIGGGALYAAFTLVVGRRWLARLGPLAERPGGLGGAWLTFVLALVMLAGWTTDAIGIYAVFGAFILGLAMPRGAFAEELERRILPLVGNLLLPLFFVYSGLNTRVSLVDSPALWGVALLVLGAACLGKGVACGTAALAHGERLREAVAIGALMNARGLMELIILNIGLERGVITPTLFSIMIIMAIVTTLMATPAFELAYGKAGSLRRIALTEAAREDERPAA